MQFSEIYKKFVKLNHGASKAQSISKQLIDDNYLSSNEYKVSHSPLWPGCFYIFKNNLRIDPLELQNKGYNYLDTHPIILSLGQDEKQRENGLNLNVIPSKIKLTIIEKYWKTYKSIIEQNAGEPFNKWKNMSDLNVNKIESISGINLDFAINKFNSGNISNIKLIDFNDVVLLIHFFNKKIIFRNNYGYSQLFQDFIKKMRQ